MQYSLVRSCWSGLDSRVAHCVCFGSKAVTEREPVRFPTPQPLGPACPVCPCVKGERLEDMRWRARLSSHGHRHRHHHQSKLYLLPVGRGRVVAASIMSTSVASGTPLWESVAWNVASERRSNETILRRRLRRTTELARREAALVDLRCAIVHVLCNCERDVTENASRMQGLCTDREPR